MRRLISVLAAAAIVAAPLATAGVAMAKDHNGGGRPEQRGHGPGEGRGWRGGGEDRRGGFPGGYPGGFRGGEDRGGGDRGGGRWERQGPRSEPRYEPRYERADPRYGGPRAYGPPSGAYEAAPRRGGYLGRGGGEVIQDPGRFRLRAPPRGYEWVRTAGGMALVSQATGQVFDVVPY